MTPSARLFALLVLIVPAVSLAGPADLDATFGTGGKVVTDLLTGFDAGRDALLLPGGRILVAGNATPSGGASRFMVARYLSDGRLDSTFGTNGFATTSFSGSFADPTCVARQSNGRILVGGYFFDGTYFSAIAAFDSSGAPDPTFGVGGRVSQTIGLDGDVRDILVQPDDKVVIAGAFRLSGTTTFMGLRRYKPTGAPDSTFGFNGTVTRGPGVDNRCQAIALADSGKLVAVGSTQLTAGASQFLTFRFRSNGTPDSSFATFGRAITPVSAFRNFGMDVEVLSDGRVLAAGYAGAAADLTHRYAVVRFLPNGARDSTFGTSGIALTPEVGVTTGFAFLEDMLVLPTGRLLLVGQGTNFGTSDDWALARMTESGLMDDTFGVAGLAYTDMSGGGRDVPYRALLQPDGRIVLTGDAGGSFFPGGPRVALARYMGDEPTVSVTPAGRRTSGVELAPPWPNPAQAAATIAYRLPVAAHVTLSVLDVQGREVATLDRGPRTAGEHRAAWGGLARDGLPAPAGLYWVRLRAEPAAGGAVTHAVQRLVITR